MSEKMKVEMTAEELAQWQALKEKQEKAERERKAKDDRDAYRSLAATTVDEVFPKLQELSSALADAKRSTYEAFAGVIDTKTEVVGLVAPGQRSHSFLGKNGDKRIIVGHYQRDGWDDTVEAGICKVKEYISSLAGDEKTRELVDIILDLLSKDRAGNLKADKVLQLEKYTERIDNDTFSEGVAIIKEAYRPERTKDFIRAQYKDNKGKWVDIPLGITEA